MHYITMREVTVRQCWSCRYGSADGVGIMSLTTLWPKYSFFPSLLCETWLVWMVTNKNKMVTLILWFLLYVCNLFYLLIVLICLSPRLFFLAADQWWVCVCVIEVSCWIDFYVYFPLIYPRCSHFHNPYLSVFLSICAFTIVSLTSFSNSQETILFLHLLFFSA